MLTLVAMLAALTGCDPGKPGGAAGGGAGGTGEAPLFESLAPTATGVSFVNELPEAKDINILNYLYYYNGGGVAAGDVNGDGLPDLYFTSNLGKNRLYLNRGGYKFEDVTDRAGVAGPGGWKTGVAMADVNGDGRLDIYVSTVTYLGMKGRNALYINNGDGTFTDRAEEMGLAHVGYSTQALFLDYDRDGDLDLFLLSHSTHTERAIGSALKRDVRSALGGGRLFRNDGGHFTDVSAEAGIYGGIEGFGLGVVATDYDGDGCLDLYVANDFQEQDFLYHNECNGRFTERIASATRHTSRFAMGVDAGDVDNDGRPDLFVADMLPDREDVLKTSAATESWNLFNLRLKAGYHAQFARNTLQLNRGGGRFSDIAFLAGVAATDWSWAPLFADVDNDGRQDLFVSSGIYRRPNDLDYINFVGNDAQQAALANAVDEKALALLKRMPQVPVANHLFRNDGDLHFTDMAAAWGLGERGFSNGAIYVDLDNTGSLDLVLSRINAPASIYRNLAKQRNGNASLTVSLSGDGANTGGIGARVRLYAASGAQLREAVPTRGFQSSVDPRLHFGLGRDTVVDSVVVTWPDGLIQAVARPPANRGLVLRQADARRRAARASATGANMLRDVTATTGLAWVHHETESLDFDREPMIPHLLSRLGPALAVGDVDGDGRDDLFVGGGKFQPSAILRQGADGRFVPMAQPAIAADSTAEDVDAAFVDVDGDGDLDLIVVPAGNEFWGNAPQLRPRLYLNDGRGNFTAAPDAMPAIFENFGCVAVGDYDGDGHPDLFLGARVVSGKYGLTPTSHLLHNDGKGRFTDVTAQVAPALAQAGMVSSAAWTDVDGDGKLDLVVVGEWMPVRVFKQVQGRFTDATAEAGLARTEGWWNHVTAADLDGDGRDDLVLGNLGRNSYITASDAEPARLTIADFQHNGTLEQVLTFFKHGTAYPMQGRDEIVRLVPSLRPKYPTYASFGASTLEQIFPAADLAKATVREARTFASAIARNRGGRFVLEPLPTLAQLAPIHAAVVTDVDGDGRVDLIVAGNDHGVPPLQGWYDASEGLLLRGTGDGRFAPVHPDSSGLRLDGDVRHMAVLRLARGGRAIVVARNNQSLTILRLPDARPVSAATRSGSPRPR